MSTKLTEQIFENVLPEKIPRELFCSGPKNIYGRCIICENNKKIVKDNENVKMESYENQSIFMSSIGKTNYTSSVYMAYMCSILIEKELKKYKKNPLVISNFGISQCGNNITILSKSPEISLLDSIELNLKLCKKVICEILRIFEILEKYNYRHGSTTIDGFLFDSLGNVCLYYFKGSSFEIGGKKYLPINSKDYEGKISAMDNFKPIFLDMFGIESFEQIASKSKSIMKIKIAIQKGGIKPQVVYNYLRKDSKNPGIL